MQIIKNKHYQETYYTKTLDNGLNVIIFYKPNFVNNVFNIITPYGGADFNQVVDNKHYNLPPGIAHFLEHRMFDYKGRDVMELFNEMGASSNASTSYNYTQYYFSTAKKDVLKPLKLLLYFVYHLDISEESVKKEKGIIVEELNMYDNLPDFKLFTNIFKNLLVNHPYKEDIGGSVNSVNNTTLDDLLLAYKLNYHPQKMYLVGSSNTDPKVILDFITDYFKDFKFDEIIESKRHYLDEVSDVAIEYSEEVMPVNKSKMIVGYKILAKLDDKYQQVKNNWLLKIFLEMIFSTVNSEYQSWLDNNIINDYFDYEISVEEDFTILIFVNEIEDKEQFTDFIEDKINKYIKYISQTKFDQIKNRYLGQAIIKTERPQSLVMQYSSKIVNGIDLFKELENLEKLAYSDLLKLIENLDFLKHRSIYMIKSNKKHQK